MRPARPDGYVSRKVYPSAWKRYGKRMCENCIRGHKKPCDLEGCPCCCNDADFKK